MAEIHTIFGTPEIPANSNKIQEKGFRGSSNMIITLHERAVRNVPYSGSLWVSYMRALERAEKPGEAVNGTVFISLLY
jgi:hypothetical protein